ncbi:TatD DNase family Scn1 [Mycena amicta]|nr:TatD DNase family Scn1 [Mycena amicta]
MVSHRVLRHIVDVHCHPTDSPISTDSMQQLGITVCAMSTRERDQRLVRELARNHPDKIIPAFAGYHPWFTHLISLHSGVSKRDHYFQLFHPTDDSSSAFEDLLSRLPEPTPLNQVLEDLRTSFASLSTSTPVLGEVGLDGSFRVAYDYDASPRRLSPFTIPLNHQLTILEAQLDLAVELGASVSLHSVKCPQATADLISKLRRKHQAKWDNIRIDIHSCSMSPEMLTQLQKTHPNVFMSISTTINGRSRNLRPLIAACAPDKLLIESGTEPPRSSMEMCLEILNIVAEVKGWHIETDWDDEDAGGAVHRLEANWNAFIGRGTV